MVNLCSKIERKKSCEKSAKFVPEGSVQVDDLVVEVVPDDHVEGADRPAAVARAAIRVLLGLESKTGSHKNVHKKLKGSNQNYAGSCQNT
jgi:hypothetical protein